MCGINGVLTRGTLQQAGLTEKHITTMRSTLSHRGPDDHGELNQGAIHLGFNRLAILDLSSAGHQPMPSADKKLWIVFNGEIYNYIELREELIRVGHAFHSQSDTEVILAAYREWGVHCLERFNGMFAFCIYDADQKKLFIARDRLGIKPLFYYASKDFFAFSSEIKALLVLGIPRLPNDQIIHDYLTKGIYDHTDETFFAQVRQLPAGHFMLIDASLRIELTQYWDLVTRSKQYAHVDHQAELRKLLTDAVRMQLRSDVPVGLHLSGGIDSNTLAVFTQQQLKTMGGELRTFTHCFNDTRFDERKYVEEMAAVLQCKQSFSYFLPSDIEPTLFQGLYHQDQPFGGVATLGYMEGAFHIKEKEHVTVVLEGQGGDELFAGYAKYMNAYLRDVSESDPAAFEREVAAISTRTGKSVHDIIASAEATGEFRHVDDTKSTAPECVAPAFLEKHERTITLPTPFASHLLNAQYHDVKYLKIPRVLRFNDHMTMAAAVELRVPILDHRIVELAFATPAELKIHNGLGKHALRELTSGVIPDSIRLRSKVSVVTPQGEWLKTDLHAFVTALITSPSFVKRPYFDAKAVQKRYEVFCADPNPPNSFFVWQWIMLELWLRMYIDPEEFVPLSL
jgi:asparagine synthase (glutamine-hydrolysing)